MATKARKKPDGLARFFSPSYSKPIRGLALFTLALLDVKQGTSTPIFGEQVIKSEAKKNLAKAKPKKKEVNQTNFITHKRAHNAPD